MYGAWFSTIGAIIAILLNFILVPIYGIYGSAWSVLAAYTIPAFLSFYFGAKHYPIPYQKSSLIFYPLIVVVFFLASSYLELGLLANIGILFLFLALVFVMETKVNPLKFKPSE